MGRRTAPRRSRAAKPLPATAATRRPGSQRAAAPAWPVRPSACGVGRARGSTAPVAPARPGTAGPGSVPPRAPPRPA
jgi:hypothetical protein